MQRDLGYRPDIDGLRAVAVVLVVLFHAFPRAMPGGFVGVDVFFVISGFLITGVVTQSGFTFSNFYLHRARRLFPALFVVLSLCLIAGYFYLTPKQFADLGRETVASALFIPNLLFWSQSGYFDAAAATKPLLHLWSLGVEEQFYLVWPALLLLSGRRSLMMVAGVLIGSLAYCLHHGPFGPDAVFYSPLARAWELAAGGILSITDWRMTRWATLGALTGTLLIIATATWFSPLLEARYIATLPAVLGATFVTMAGSSVFSQRVLGAHIPVYLGKISYPLYLWHWPILAFITVETGHPPATVAACFALAVSVALAILTYQLIERPTRTKLNLRSAALAATAVLAISGCAGLSISALDGIPSRLPPSLQKALAYERYNLTADAMFPKCWLSQYEVGKLGRDCIKKGRPDAIAVWGDSHDARLTPGLRAIFGADRISQLTRSDCAPLASPAPSIICTEGNRVVLDTIRSSAPKIVVLFAAWEHYSEDWSPASTFGKQLQMTMSALRQAGSFRIVLVGPSPKFDISLPSMLMRNWAMKRWNVVPDRLDIERAKTIAIDRDLSFAASSNGIAYISMIDAFCNDDGCLTKTPGSASDLVTPDYGHFTTSGSLIAAYAVEPAIVAAEKLNSSTERE